MAITGDTAVQHTAKVQVDEANSYLSKQLLNKRLLTCSRAALSSCSACTARCKSDDDDLASDSSLLFVQCA
jgi:uncharacterized protein (DUF1810 family)